MSKISKKELTELKESEQKKGAILHDLGLLETQKHQLLHYYAELMNDLEKQKQELEKSYGKIDIDLTDGSYKLIKDEENK